MILSKNRKDKSKGIARPPVDVNHRLADVSARIDAARKSSVIRRPIFNRSLDRVAYEVVVGGGSITDLSIADPPGGGPRGLVVNHSIDLDVAAISAGVPVHLPVSSLIIEKGLPAELGSADVMLLLGQDVEPTPETTAAVEQLRSAGYRVVLDDIVKNTHLQPLIRHADAVKIGVDTVGSVSVAKQISVLKTAGVELIADRVETYEEMRSVTRMGFSQFQGTFLSRPDGFRKPRASAGQVASLELITLLQDPDAQISDIAEVIRQDVDLSYKIMKIVNSAQYSLPRPLGSIEEAVVLVGIKRIVSWAGMMTLSGISDKPSELTRLALVRARVCEDLAQVIDRPDYQRFYVVGLFSVIEALLDIPADKALANLPLATEIVHAITADGGVMGEVLRAVIAFEKGDWDRAHIIGAGEEVISFAFRKAMIEVDDMWTKVSG